MIWRYCTECGKQFSSANNLCPYCSYQNKPLPEPEKQNVVGDDRQLSEMTIKEANDYLTEAAIIHGAGRFIVGNLRRGRELNELAEREEREEQRHRELMEELRNR